MKKEIIASDQPTTMKEPASEEISKISTEYVREPVSEKKELTSTDTNESVPEGEELTVSSPASSEISNIPKEMGEVKGTSSERRDLKMKEIIASDQPTTMKEPASEEISKISTEYAREPVSEKNELTSTDTNESVPEGEELTVSSPASSEISNIPKEMSEVKELAYERIKEIAGLLSNNGVPPPNLLLSSVRRPRKHILGIRFSDPNTHILGILFPNPNGHVLGDSSNPDSLQVIRKSSFTNEELERQWTSVEWILKETAITRLINHGNMLNVEEENFPSEEECNDRLEEIERLIHDINITLIEGINVEEIDWDPIYSSYKKLRKSLGFTEGNSEDDSVNTEGNSEDDSVNTEGNSEDDSVNTEGNTKDTEDDSVNNAEVNTEEFYWRWKWKALYGLFKKHEDDFQSLKEYTKYFQDLEDLTFGSMEWMDHAILNDITSRADIILNYGAMGLEQEEEEINSEMGAQTETEDRSVCTNYSRHGICKYGRFCRYDHGRPTTRGGG